MEEIRRELDNLAHTLNDIHSTIKCSERLLAGHVALVESLKKRMDPLQTRMDMLAIQIGEKEYEKVS